MKSITIDPAIQVDLSLMSSIRRANELLDHELGRSSGSVDAAWDFFDEKHDPPLIRLTISDWTGHAEAVFTPSNLGDSRLTRNKLNWLWGDLLQVRSHKLLDEMQAGSSSLVGDG